MELRLFKTIERFEGDLENMSKAGRIGALSSADNRDVLILYIRDIESKLTEAINILNEAEKHHQGHSSVIGKKIRLYIDNLYK